MDIAGEVYVLLYSESQSCFHIEKMGIMLRNNYRIFVNSRKVDYIPLAVAHTIDELEAVKAELVKARAKVLEDN